MLQRNLHFATFFSDDATLKQESPSASNLVSRKAQLREKKVKIVKDEPTERSVTPIKIETGVKVEEKAAPKVKANPSLGKRTRRESKMAAMSYLDL